MFDSSAVLNSSDVFNSADGTTHLPIFLFSGLVLGNPVAQKQFLILATVGSKQH